MAHSFNIRELNELKKNYSSLLESLQTEVEFYKKEHESLRNEILALRKRKNSTNNIDLTGLTGGGDGQQKQPYSEEETADIIAGDLVLKHKQLSDDSLKNLKSQMRVMATERDTVYALWQTGQKTCANIDAELTEYKRLWRQPDSVTQLKRDLNGCRKTFESKLNELEMELAHQRHENVALIKSKNELVQQLASVEDKYQKFMLKHNRSMDEVQQTESSINSAKIHIADLMRQRTELEKRLAQSQAALDEHMVRETISLNKVQEMLHIAEVAIADKNEAREREQEMKEECENLASTIGQVMEDAAIKCEENMRDWQRNYETRIECLEERIGRQIDDGSHLMQQIDLAQKRVRLLETELTKTLQSNQRLDSELQVACRTIIDMELKLQAFEKILEQEKLAKSISEEKTKEMQEFLRQSDSLKQRWKTTVDEVVANLQAQLCKLQSDKVILKNENLKLSQQMENIRKQNPQNRGYFELISELENTYKS